MSFGPPLAYLADQGFENLTGIAINPDAFDVMAEYYPTLATEGTFHSDPIGDILNEFDDGQFDVVYSVETLQHLHPDFEERIQVTDSLLLTVENEGAVDKSQSSVLAWTTSTIASPCTTVTATVSSPRWTSSK